MEHLVNALNTVTGILSNPVVGWSITALFGVLAVFFGARLSKVSNIIRELRDVAEAYDKARKYKEKAASNGVIDAQEQAQINANYDKIQKELVETAIAVAALFKK